jgi:glycerate 2-kinase
MHILIAPNAFKNSITATAAAAAIEQGFLESRLPCTTRCFPVGDGGDGTGTLITQALQGILVEETVKDPLGRDRKASMGLIDQGLTAVIEMAAASGLRLLHSDELDPLHASSYGTGQLMQKAMDRGVTKIILCVGGSATVDGGTGILTALGIRFLNAEGQELTDMPESLVQLASIDTSQLDHRIHNTECIILCDVKNGLLGAGSKTGSFPHPICNHYPANYWNRYQQYTPWWCSGWYGSGFVCLSRCPDGEWDRVFFRLYGF